jgi:hypothetical protein
MCPCVRLLITPWKFIESEIIIEALDQRDWSVSHAGRLALNKIATDSH